MSAEVWPVTGSVEHVAYAFGAEVQLSGASVEGATLVSTELIARARCFIRNAPFLLIRMVETVAQPSGMRS